MHITKYSQMDFTDYSNVEDTIRRTFPSKISEWLILFLRQSKTRKFRSLRKYFYSVTFLLTLLWIPCLVFLQIHTLYSNTYIYIYESVASFYWLQTFVFLATFVDLLAKYIILIADIDFGFSQYKLNVDSEFQLLLRRKIVLVFMYFGISYIIRLLVVLLTSSSTIQRLYLLPAHTGNVLSKLFLIILLVQIRQRIYENNKNFRHNRKLIGYQGKFRFHVYNDVD